jgi:ABC-2 type transport system permease protein
VWTEFRHTLRRLRGSALGWGIGLALYALMMVSFYPSIVNLKGQFLELVSGYPKAFAAFFGDLTDLFSPSGYLDLYYFGYLTPIIGIFAAGACAGLLAGDEEKGLLDLVLAHPVGRTALFWGRFLGFVAALAGILLLSYLAWAIPSQSVEFGLSWGQLLLPFLPMFAVLFLFGALALLLSLLLPSSRAGGMLSGGLLIANFLLMGLSRLYPDALGPLVRFTPLYYYQGGKAALGLNGVWLGGLLASGLLLLLPAWFLFLRRDIRVGGEHGWHLPALPWRRG